MLSAQSAESSLKNDSLSAAWLAYDMSLALSLKKPISSFTLTGRATGLELVLLLDQTVSLMTQAPLLKTYKKLYPNASSFRQDLVRDFDLLSLMDKIPIETPEVWRHAADAVGTIRASAPSKLRVALRSLVRSNLIVQDFDQGKKRFGFSNVALNLQEHLSASCDLA